MSEFLNMQFGSHVYGTNVPTSDQDFKGIFLPEVRDMILQRAAKNVNHSTGDDKSKNTKDDVDVELFSYAQFLKLLLQGQTGALDMLFTPEKFYLFGFDNHHWRDIVDNKEKFLHSGTSAFAGYCQGQAAKYSLKGSNLAAFRLAKDFFEKQPPNVKVEHRMSEIESELIQVAKEETKYHDKGSPIIKWVDHPEKDGKTQKYLQIGPKTKHGINVRCRLAADIWKYQFDRYGERAKAAESNEGIDWKALMHAVRIAAEAKELLLTGNITFPRPEKDVLLKIRKGEYAYKKVAEMITVGLDELNEAKLITTLPEKPDHKFAEELVYQTYGAHLYRHLCREYPLYPAE